MKQYIRFFVLLCLLYPVADAHGNPFDILGVSPRAIALGGAYSTMASDPSAAYYNPAGLTRVRKTQVQVYYSFSVEDMSVGQPTGAEINAAFGATEGEKISARIGAINQLIDDPNTKLSGGIAWYDYDQDGIMDPTTNARLKIYKDIQQAGNLRDITGYTLAIASDINEYFYFGLLNYNPLDNLFASSRIKFVSSPFYLDYDNRPQRAVILPAVGFKIYPGVALGMSLLYQNTTDGKLMIDLPMDDPDKSLSITGDVIVRAQPKLNFGLLLSGGRLDLGLWQIKNINFGVNYFEKSMVQSVSRNLVHVTILNTEKPIDKLMKMKATNFFSPRQITLGLSGEVAPFCTLSVDYEFEFWKKYIPPYSNAIYILPVEGDESTQTLVTNPNIQPMPFMQFSDIQIPRMGLEFAPAQNLALRIGYYFEKSPVPDQIAVTNVLDADKHVISFGLGTKLNLFRKIAFLPEQISIDFFGQIAMMASQVVAKNKQFFQAIDPAITSQCPNPISDPDGYEACIAGQTPGLNTYLQSIKDNNVESLIYQSLLAEGMIRDEVMGTATEPNYDFDTSNPGYPVIALGGTMYDFGIMVGLQF